MFMLDMTVIAMQVSQLLDFVGILAILFGAVLSTIYTIAKFFQGAKSTELYRIYRWSLARSILIGLEFLVAGDIIRSVGGQLTFDGVILLGIIVIIRSFLSIEFEMELEGRWPWQRHRPLKIGK